MNDHVANPIEKPMDSDHLTVTSFIHLGAIVNPTRVEKKGSSEHLVPRPSIVLDTRLRAWTLATMETSKCQCPNETIFTECNGKHERYW